MSTASGPADESLSNASVAESASSDHRSSDSHQDSVSTADEVVSRPPTRTASIAEIENVPQPAQTAEDETTSTEVRPASPSHSERRDNDNASVPSTLPDLEDGPPSLPTGIPIHPWYRSSVYLIALFFIAIVLMAITIAFASTSFSQSLIYNPPFFPYSPQYAILVLQILATLSLMVMQECFCVCSEIFRWTLACHGTNVLSFLIMSSSTGFGGLVNILITKPKRIAAPWRLLAIYKLLALYIAFIFGQFVWLLAINSRLAYQIVGQSPPDEFTLPQSVSISFLGAFDKVPGYFVDDIESFLTDRTYLYQGPVSTCTDNPGLECAVNYLPCNRAVEHSGAPAPMALVYSMPTIITAFKTNISNTLDLDSFGPWAYCLNYISPSDSYLAMCVDAVQRESNGNTTVVKVGMESTYQRNYRDAGRLTVTTNITLSTALCTVFLGSGNISVMMIETQTALEPLGVNLTDFFSAFSFPLNTSGPSPVEFGNTTAAANEFVDFVAQISQDSSLVSQFLYGCIGYIFSYNQIEIGPQFNSSEYYVQPANALTLSPVSVIGYTLVSGIMLGSSLIMWFAFPKTKRPNISSYPELTFAGKMTDEIVEMLKGLSNAADRAMLERLVDVRIQVGEDEEGTKVVISTSHAKPLRKGVLYT